MVGAGVEEQRKVDGERDRDRRRKKEIKKDGCDQIEPLQSIWTFCYISRNRVFPGGIRPFDFGLVKPVMDRLPKTIKAFIDRFENH